jgi:LmbE family N-acetylglucosaminyl deacetylase
MSLDVLAIAAHPDDIEQTCGGTLIRMAEAGYRCGAPDLTAGDRLREPEQRVAESECAARHMLLAWRGNLHFPDARLENTISARMTLAVKIRELKPRVVILPYWQARHPDHYRCCEMGFEACFLAGLRKLDEYTEPHRPQKVLYASLYADVKPSFIAISARSMLDDCAVARRMARAGRAATSSPTRSIRDRLAIARFTAIRSAEVR